MQVGFSSGIGSMGVPRPNQLHRAAGSNHVPGHRPSNAVGVGVVAGAGAGVVVGAVSTCGVGLVVAGVVGGVTALGKALRENAINRSELIDQAVRNLRRDIDRCCARGELRLSIRRVYDQEQQFVAAGRNGDRLDILVRAQERLFELSTSEYRFRENFSADAAAPLAIERLVRSVERYNASFFAAPYHASRVAADAAAWQRQLGAGGSDQQTLRNALGWLLHAKATQPAPAVMQSLDLALYHTFEALMPG